MKNKINLVFLATIVVNFWVLIDNALPILFLDNCGEQHVVHLFNFFSKIKVSFTIPFLVDPALGLTYDT
jgi:hypothetical protein